MTKIKELSSKGNRIYKVISVLALIGMLIFINTGCISSDNPTDSPTDYNTYDTNIDDNQIETNNNDNNDKFGWNTTHIETVVKSEVKDYLEYPSTARFFNIDVSLQDKYAVYTDYIIHGNFSAQNSNGKIVSDTFTIHMGCYQDGYSIISLDTHVLKSSKPIAKDVTIKTSSKTYDNHEFMDWNLDSIYKHVEIGDDMLFAIVIEDMKLLEIYADSGTELTDNELNIIYTFELTPEYDEIRDEYSSYLLNMAVVYHYTSFGAWCMQYSPSDANEQFDTASEYLKYATTYMVNCGNLVENL